MYRCVGSEVLAGFIISHMPFGSSGINFRSVLSEWNTRAASGRCNVLLGQLCTVEDRKTNRRWVGGRG